MERYLYDWQADYTNDPKIKGNLPKGKHCHKVFYNDREIDLPVVRLLTGERGWIVVQTRVDGKYAELQYDTWNNRFIQPDEKQPEVQCYKEDSPNPKYVSIDTYTLYGKVSYEYATN